MTGGKKGRREEARQGGGIEKGKKGGNEAENTKEEREEGRSAAGWRTEARVDPSNETKE